MNQISLCRFRFESAPVDTVRNGILVGNVLHVLPPQRPDELVLTAILDKADPLAYATELASQSSQTIPAPFEGITWLSPLERQEVWGTGMTYQKDVDANGKDLSLYEQAYLSDRPFFFFKSSGHATAGSGGTIRVRPDSSNTIAEPELTIVISSSGNIAGYTIGSDVTARDIEGQNPLYQSLSKCYDGSCAAGPWIRLCSFADLNTSAVRTRQVRKSQVIFAGETNLSQLVKSPETIGRWFLRGGNRQFGAAILTGNGVPFPADLTLLPGDEVTHEIEGLGVQTTTVAS